MTDDNMQELELLGLSPKEQHIYKILLHTGILSASEVAKHASIKRSTIYLHLEQMQQKGLALEVINKNKRYFQGADPKVLRQLVKAKLQQIDKLKKKLPKIIQKLRVTSSKRSYRKVINQKSYRGVLGMRQIIDEVASTNGDVYFLGSIKGIHKYFSPELLEKIYKKPRRRNLRTDYLITDWANSAVRRFFEESGMFTKIRFLPPELNVNGGFLLLNNRVVIGHYLPEISLVAIEEASLVALFRMTFLSLWKDLEGKNIPSMHHVF